MKNRGMIWWWREERSDDEEQWQKTDLSGWLDDLSLICTKNLEGREEEEVKLEWGFEWEVADERRWEFLDTDGFSAADEMRLSPPMGLLMGFLMFALVLGWGLYV